MGFKENIKARRLELGLTTEDVAKVVGVSNATISRWETGAITNQRRDKLQLLAKALHTTPAALMGWEEQKPPEALSDERFAELFNDLDARDQDTVLRLMQSMRDARSER